VIKYYDHYGMLKDYNNSILYFRIIFLFIYKFVIELFNK